MNFPDLETCRQISAEFQNSEFVWVRSPFRADIYTKLRSDTENSVVCDLAPAPTCEELGVWITESPKMQSWAKKQTTHGIRQQIDAMIANLIADCAYSNKGETQARAEAVALAIKNNQGVVE